jgi:hypothetical protein
MGYSDITSVVDEIKNKQGKSQDWADPFASELENLVALATKDFADSASPKPEEIKLAPVTTTPKNKQKKVQAGVSVQIRIPYFAAAACLILLLCAGVIAAPKIHASLNLAPQLDMISKSLQTNNEVGYTALDAAADMGNFEYRTVNKQPKVDLSEQKEEAEQTIVHNAHERIAGSAMPIVTSASASESFNLETILAALIPPNGQVCQ